MENDMFIGAGHNPQGQDLPIGFSMKLAQVPHAVEAYGRLTDAQRSQIIHYIQESTTGEEAEQRVMNAVNALAQGHMNFYR